MGVREQFKSSGEGGGNVKSAITACLWHVIFEKKRIGMCSPF